jgi:hypothetical protein
MAVEHAGKLQFRMQFAERYPDEDALSNALDKHGSWHEIVNTGLTVDRRGEKRPVVAVVDLASLLAHLRAREGGAE